MRFVMPGRSYAGLKIQAFGGESKNSWLDTPGVGVYSKVNPGGGS